MGPLDRWGGVECWKLGKGGKRRGGVTREGQEKEGQRFEGRHATALKLSAGYCATSCDLIGSAAHAIWARATIWARPASGQEAAVVRHFLFKRSVLRGAGGGAQRGLLTTTIVIDGLFLLALQPGGSGSRPGGRVTHTRRVTLGGRQGRGVVRVAAKIGAQFCCNQGGARSLPLAGTTSTQFWGWGPGLLFSVLCCTRS